MSKKINCTQAYKAMLHFFDMISFETGDEEVAIFSSYGELYMATPGECPQTMDAAMWNYWMRGLKLVIGDNSITYEFELTIEQGYAAVYQYIVIFCDLGAEPSVHQLKNLLSPGAQESAMKSWLYNHWLRSVEYILQEDPFKKYGLFFNRKTKVTQRESFVTLQIFLDRFCKKNNNEDLILLVQNSRLKQRGDYWAEMPDIIEQKIWDLCQQSIEIVMQKEENKVLNLLSAYRAIPIFLMNYFGNGRSDFINKFIQQLYIEEPVYPARSSYFDSWTISAGIANMEQTQICYDVISIHDPISHEVAFNIIQAWLQYKKDLIGSDVAQQVLADTQGMQQAIDEIKQLQRSYLLLDNEVIVLETYHIMTKLLELHGKVISEFAIDENGKPADFEILLDWIRICEQVIKK